MKKTLLSSLASLAIAWAFIGWSANAELDIMEVFPRNEAPTVQSFQRLLTEYSNTRWFEEDARPESQNISDNWVTFSFKKVRDDTTTEATQYRLFVSQYRVNDIMAWNDSINPADIIIKNVKWEKGNDIVNFEVNLSDGLEPSQVYYGFITPIEEYDSVWRPSAEICFNLENHVLSVWEACDSLSLLYDQSSDIEGSENQYGEGNAWEAANDEWNVDWQSDENWGWEDHGAAQTCDAGMDLANVSHTISNNRITLTWTSLWGCDVQIAIIDPTEEEYVSLWSVPMSNERFDYDMQRDWEHIFMLTNGIKEVVYKVDASRSEEVVEEWIVATPQTGPAQNMLLIVIAAIIVYGAYSVFFRKNEN